MSGSPVVCSHWFHQTCGEDNGMIDDHGLSPARTVCSLSSPNIMENLLLLLAFA